MKYAQNAAACDPSTSSQDVFGLVVCFFYHVGGILLDKRKAVPETHPSS